MYTLIRFHTWKQSIIAWGNSSSIEPISLLNRLRILPDGFVWKKLIGDPDTYANILSCNLQTLFPLHDCQRNRRFYRFWIIANNPYFISDRYWAYWQSFLLARKYEGWFIHIRIFLSFSRWQRSRRINSTKSTTFLSPTSISNKQNSWES